jgi:AcrR family transcriptional regulator
MTTRVGIVAPRVASMNATKSKLLDAAVESLREDGIAGLSARAIAGRAGVNQALIFYHFGTVGELVDAACRLAVDQSADFYREKLAEVTSLTELLAVGRELHERERAAGNVAMMAQLMSGAQRDETLAGAARYAMARWNDEIEAVVRRVLRDNPLAEVADPAGVARAISAGFIGLELYEGVDAEGAELALGSLESLGLLVDVLDDLGPVARRALRAKVRSTKRR